MLGIRLDACAEERLTRYAREAGRPKSVLVRDWINERLDREETDRKIYGAALLDREERNALVDAAGADATSAFLRMLDAEDGGYDWGPDGPPA
ncbi:hypothetical protein KZX46_14435 [Polymorphobacter sp. PAMC 29334]|uniref:hypothetical protein n=1 Tax=Polymorphobacter sp. PAMC 29334 TaxID=2862331 RepID=UPI001C7549A6|nr:hypothetical protein [Polymorphobacter sp. PAMC 29334]QYE34005.1 hypothetical protein KZX46_14435 [Polymorphobacter sp. PAMC 29334]